MLTLGQVRYKQSGASLLELMVGIFLALSLLTGVLFIYSAGEKKNINTLRFLTLSDQLRDVMSMMVNDLRRAGYWANADGDPANNNNPHTPNRKAYTINAAGNCILLKYDRDQDGALPAQGTGADDERYGYRLKNQVMQARITHASASCDSEQGWVNLTDAKVVRMTALTITEEPFIIDLDGNGPGTSALKINSLRLTLTGQLKDDAATQLTLITHVRIRNDVYVP